MLETKVLLCPTNHLSAVMLSCTHTQEQPEDTENRKQLALQGLHISGLSQCAPKYSCPSCPISSSETSGSFLPPSLPPARPPFLCILEPFLTSVAGALTSLTVHARFTAALRRVEQKRYVW